MKLVKRSLKSSLVESTTPQLQDVLGERGEKWKGIKKAKIKRNITHNYYKECLFSGNMQMRKMNVIRSHGHRVFIETTNKIA